MSDYDGPDIRAGGGLEDEGGAHGGWGQWADIRAALTGSVPMPDVFTRTDGRCTFYRGKVNALLGYSETGKSLVAQAAVVEAIAAGEHVVYLDHESDAPSVVSRLVSLGANPDNLETRLHYMNPEGLLSGEEAEVFLEYLDNLMPALIIVDGLTAAMESQGLEVNSNRDAATIFRTYLRPMTRCDAAVVLIHHLPKGGSNGGHGLGAATLKNLVRGLQLEVSTSDKDRHTPGRHGRSRLEIAKDSDGGVRMFAHRQTWAVFETSSTPTGTEDAYGRPLFSTEWALKVPGEGLEDGPTGCMEAVSHYMEAAGEPVSLRNIEDADLGAGFSRDTRRWAVRCLEEAGNITKPETGKGKSAAYSVVTPYREPAESVEDAEAK